jgi:pimeloyl-ACP methyl ester carboxylesterase
MGKNILSMTAVAVITMILASFIQRKPTQYPPVKNVVLVHGAFLDGSGWEPVYNILVKKGYKVSIAQHSLQSLATDIGAVSRVIDQQDGPCILVGHSYGGVIISQAGNNSKVAGLVYIAAHAPEANEKRSELFKKYPPAYTSLIKGDDGYDYISPEHFPADFAADLPREKARFMANAQMPTADICFQGLIDHPAWKTKPSWYMVAKADRIINPDLERFYAQRMKARKTLEIDGGSHSIYTSRPQEVARLIEEASMAVLK